MSPVIFVDFENVKITDLAPLVGHPCQISLLLGAQQKSVPTSLLVSSAKLRDQVTLIEVGASGRNALDITLAHYLGRAIERQPEGHFFIISKDKDYEPLIAHLRAQGCTVSRHESLAALPFLKPAAKRPGHAAPKAAKASKAAAVARVPAAKAEVAGSSRIDRLISSLANPSNKTRPTTRKRLHAYVMNTLGKDAADVQVEAAIQQLQETGTLAIDDAGRVRYRE